MPLPRLTEKILASTKEIEEGWSLLELKEVRAASAKNEGGGTNYFFDFEAISGPNSGDTNKGRSATMMINGKGLDAGIAQVCAAYVGCICALTGSTEAEVLGADLDEDRLKGRKCWADIQRRIVDGKSYLDFRAFSPVNVVPY
jgi:hypothetical protein